MSCLHNVVFPLPDGAEMMKNASSYLCRFLVGWNGRGAHRIRLPFRRPALLHILNLFAQFFQFGFHTDDQCGDVGVVRFRADGVHFAPHFLEKKL